MSLVSDALKKAEREAAAREARAKGLPAPLETPVQPYRARRGQRPAGGRALWLALGVVLALGVLALVGMRSPSGEKSPHKEGTDSTSAPPVTGPASVPSKTAEVVSPTEAPAAPAVPSAPAASAKPAPSGQTEPPSEREATVAEPSPPSVQTAPKERPAPPSAGEPLSPSAPPRPAPAAPAPRSGSEYVRRVDFPDGSKLELGGIAYSETAPFAYLNGKLLKIGEGVAGYTLVAIERDRVRVTGPAGELTLRLKPR